MIFCVICVGIVLITSLVLNFWPLVDSCSSLFTIFGMSFSPIVNSCSWFGDIVNYKNWAPEKPFQNLPPLIFSVATIMAIMTYWWERDKAASELERSRSDFYFRQASKGLDVVFNLLKDLNNDRVIWIEAARTLLEAKKFSDKIKLNEFKQAYLLHEKGVRHDLYLVLAEYNEETGEREYLSPQFFYGTKDWKDKTLEQVAADSTSPIEAYSVVLGEKIPEPRLSCLAEKSVCAIFDFVEYPKGEDPLDEIQVWEEKSEDWDRVFGHSRGAAEYIYHKNHNHSVGGKVFPLSPNKDKPPA